MKIRCPKCRRHFEYEPSSGPAHCPHEDCDWSVEPSPAPENVVEKPAGTLAPAAETSPEILEHSGAVPKVSYIHCPHCTARIPDYEDICPACGADLLSDRYDPHGLRALFHVTGDITFTPKMVVFLFVVTLAAILTFTWLLTGRRVEDGNLARLDLMTGSVGFEGQIQGVAFAQLKNELLDPTGTGFRKDAVSQKFLGKRVIWSGLVREVSSKGGQPVVDLVMEQLESRSFVTLHTLVIAKNTKLIGEMTRGQKVLFSGKIADFDIGGATDAFNYFRVVLKDGIILQ
ncbi:hypothetical protein ACFL4P_01605 [Gemmatimonadota bacterium]